MANAKEITSLLREQSNLNDQFQSVSKLLDEYERSGQQSKLLVAALDSKL